MLLAHAVAGQCLASCFFFQNLIGDFPPKWMVKITENPIEMDDFGGKTHYFRKHPIYTLKLTAVLAPENQRLEDEVSFWPWPIFRGKLAVRSRDGEAK